MHTIITTYSTQRLPSSRMGNPRYLLIANDGSIIGATETDSMLAYGDVPNNAGKECVVQYKQSLKRHNRIISVKPVK